MTHLLMSRGILGDPAIIDRMKHVIKPEHKVLIIALSYFEHQFSDHQNYLDDYMPGGEYHEKMLLSFEPYGIKASQIMWLLDGKDTTETATEKIHQADIIYLPGGAPDLFMKRIHDLKIADSLEHTDAIWIGSSAGAMIQLETYHISPDHDYPVFSIQKGLNLLKGFLIEVHFRRRKKQKSSMRKMRRLYQKPLYIIPDDGALLITDSQIAPIASARLYYGKHGVIK